MLLPLVLNLALEVLDNEITQEKHHEDWKEGNKLLLFIDKMIVDIENPKESAHKLLELISECNKITGYRINIKNNFKYQLQIIRK